MVRFLSLLILLFFSCSTKEHLDVIIDEIPHNQMEFQKMLIAQLSGETPIKIGGFEKIIIKDRWTSKNKLLSKEYIEKVIEKIGLEPKIQSYTIPNSNFVMDLLIEPIRGHNIYTILPSTVQSNEYVILGAHYDTGGRNVPGAIDNGSGIALILGVLEKVQALEFRNKNIMIVFFDQEEEGISAGSAAFANYLNQKVVKIHSVHSFDMIGWDSDNNNEIELELPSIAIENLYKKHASRLNIPIYSTKINSSDHYSFIKKGINAVGVSQAYGKGDNSGLKDTSQDKYPLVNFEYLESSTNLAYEVIKELMDD